MDDPARVMAARPIAGQKDQKAREAHVAQGLASDRLRGVG
jgi:hypothetical protein